MDIHTYNREAEDIDEIQSEDRQERMAKQKARSAHLRYLRHEESKEHCHKHMCDYQKEKGCPICNRLETANAEKANLEVEDE